MTRTGAAAPVDDRLAIQLAEDGCTPAFVYDLDLIAQRAKRLRGYAAGADLFYSMKSNPNPHVAGALAAVGLGLDVSSAHEARTAARATARPGERLLMTGPGKTEADLRAFADVGGRLLSVESLTELGRVAGAYAARGLTALVLLRVATADPAGRFGRGRGGHFGMDDATVEHVLDAGPARPGVQVAGLHFFRGSNVPDADRFVAGMERSLEHAERFLPHINSGDLVVDLGGGFPASFATEARPDYLPDVAPFLEDVPGRLAAAAGGRPLRVLYETGRAVVGPGGCLVTTVLDVKEVGSRRVVVLESGVNHLVGSVAVTGRPMRELELRVAGSPGDDAPSTVVADIVGPLCAPFDVLARDVTCPLPRPGDTVVIPGVGAYGPSAGLVGFLSRPPAAEVCVKEGAVVAIEELRLSRTSRSTGDRGVAR